MSGLDDWAGPHRLIPPSRIDLPELDSSHREPAVSCGVANDVARRTLEPEVWQSAAMNELTPKQRRFVEAYVGPARGNASEAALIAGYRGSPQTLRAVATKTSRNLTSRPR